MGLEFDKTREAIGFKNMSASEREAMLKKFRDSGGEVLNERDKQEETEQRKRHTGRNYISLSKIDTSPQAEVLSGKQKASPGAEEEVKKCFPAPTQAF